MTTTTKTFDIDTGTTTVHLHLEIIDDTDDTGGGDPPVVTEPPAVVVPAGTNAVRVKGTDRAFPLAYVDPVVTRNQFDGERGPNELGLYTPAYGQRADVNAYGASVQLVADNGGAAVAGAYSSGQLFIPTKGAVLSGHSLGRVDDAAAFVRSLKPGDLVEFVHLDVVDPPVVVVPPSVTGLPVLGEYLMDGQGTTADLSPACNRLLVAFLQGEDIVEWGGQSPAQAGTDFTGWVTPAAGQPRTRDIVVSLGGQGGKVNLPRVDETVARLNATRFPVHGIDFDNEAFDVTPDIAVGVATDTSAALGLKPEQFVVQFVPPGGPPVAKALACAVAVQRKGFRVYFGQQGYETDMTDKVFMDLTGTAVAALGQEAVLGGIMLGDSHHSWDRAAAVRRLAAARAKWPRLGGAYWWEARRTGTKESVTEVAKVFGL